MIAQHNLGCADANGLRHAAANFVSSRIEIVEERLDELIKVLALRRQLERPPTKQRHAEEFLQLNDLAAHGGLLNAVGHIAHGFADATMFGDVIKQFEVMNVHRTKRCPGKVYQLTPQLQAG